MIIKRFAALFSIAGVLMLTACGFQLRGSGPNGTLPFKSVQIVGGGSSFATSLKRYIQAGGIDVVNDPKKAEAIIEILKESRNRTVLSLNSQGRVREYNLLYGLQFRVKDSSNAILLAPSDITLSRVLTFNENQVLAKESEENMLYRDMQDDMVQQVLRRVAAIKPVAPATATEPAPAPAPAPASAPVPAK